MQLPPDPRLESSSTYNREVAIAAVTEFYQFLTKPPFLEPTDIVYPPPEGWPQITRESLGYLNKNDEQITPWSGPCDYRKEDLHRYIPVTGDDFQFPPWVINLTYSTNRGKDLMLDTTDGTVTEYDGGGFDNEPDYVKGDPRYWRVECEEITMPLPKFLIQWKKKYLDLEWIPHVQNVNSSPRIYEWHGRASSSVKEMRQIYIAHGWPESFRRDDCQKELERWHYLNRYKR